MMLNFTKLEFGKGLSATLVLLFFSVSVFAQQKITGRVTTAEEPEPLPGATVQVKGTSKGAVADIDGNYSLDASEDAILVVSYVGFKSQEIPVGGRTQIDIQLEVDLANLEEIVVVGYGGQSRKDLTSAISTIDNEEIVKTPTAQAMQSLQGKVAGVQIVSNGAPGAGPTVRVRGIGSLPGLGNSSPLYVVDGMFFDNIDFLNPTDIQSISVLKDASAAAIYGVRAANGVVLVETKSGTYDQSPEVTYDGYYGMQRAQNVLKMANTEQFVQYIQETGDQADISFIDNAIQRYGRSRVNPELPVTNTDWYGEVMRLAPQQNHSVNVNGGTKTAKYAIGASYFQQEGLIEGMQNDFERTNFRAKIDFNVSERLDVGGNAILSNSTQFNAPGSVWFNSYFAVPTLPVRDTLNRNASPVPLANAQLLGYRGRQNPFHAIEYNNDRNQVADILGNFYFDYQIIPNKLSFRMAYNYNYSTFDSRNVDFAFNDGQTNFQNGLYKQKSRTFNQIWDNNLTYTENIGKHSFTLMGGYSFRSEESDGLFVGGNAIRDLQKGQEELWYFLDGTRNTKFILDEEGEPIGSFNDDNIGDFASQEFGVSYLARLAYNYDDRYLFYSTFRRDGTNKFTAKWGNFLTFGAGWVISEESFFNAEFVDFLKFRGSWGQLGNDAIAAATGQPTRNSIVTALADQRFVGLEIDNAFDRVDVWETTSETNIGITASLMDDRLSVEADVYRRDTDDAVSLLLLPGQRSIIRRNVASIRNEGFEMVINWQDKISPELSYSVGANLTTLRNEVLDLGGPNFLNAGSAEFRQRSIVGEAINSFYGYQVEGVFQTEEEIASSGYSEDFIRDAGLEPGDFQYRDQNGDGVINSDDRVVLGSYLPDLNYGFNLGVNYRQFGLSANFQGQAGHQILNRKRGEIIFTTDTNIDAELADNLWRGAGTSDRYPSAAGLRKGYNQQMSDYYVEDGDYFRVQNVRLSYTLAGQSVGNVKVPKTRFYLTAERPITIFNYNGFNPEVASGVDRQTYPIPAVYTVGLNVKLF